MGTSTDYTLDGYTLEYMPAPGGYSGYNPQRTRSEEKTLSSTVAFDWGIVDEDIMLVLEAPHTSAAEFLSLQGRYTAEDSYGVPKRYTFQDLDRDYEVEVAGLEGGQPYRHIRLNPRLTLRVLSVGA